MQPFPQFEGTDVKLQKDTTGKLFGTAFIDTVKASGSGWVDYMWPKPGETQPSRKWTYVKAATVDGVPALVGAGFYPERDDTAAAYSFPASFLRR